MVDEESVPRVLVASSLEVSGDWAKSRYSTPNGNCVEAVVLKDNGLIALRNSEDPDGPALVFTRQQMDAFVRGVEVGDFDFTR